MFKFKMGERKEGLAMLTFQQTWCQGHKLYRLHTFPLPSYQCLKSVNSMLNASGHTQRQTPSLFK